MNTTTDKLMMGDDGFYWWMGVVEDNGDPFGYGRCRVRIVGQHSSNYDTLPTNTLPWATPSMPINNAGIAGIGSSPIGPQPGTRVWGFFADGKTKQRPIMIGTLVGEIHSALIGNPEPGSTLPQPIFEEAMRQGMICDEADCVSDMRSSGDTPQIPERVDARSIDVNAGEWVIPCTGFISSGFRTNGRPRHNGVDICTAFFFEQTKGGTEPRGGLVRGPTNVPVVAVADGEVASYYRTNRVGRGGTPSRYDLGQGGPSSAARSFGNVLMIKHRTSSGNFTTVYAHLGESQDPADDWRNEGAGMNVRPGDTVSKGQVIGTIGRTHVRSSVTHLHFELHPGYHDGYPGGGNAINPASIFPQLASEHSQYISWANTYKWDDPEIPNLPENDAPVIQGEGPE